MLCARNTGSIQNKSARGENETSSDLGRWLVQLVQLVFSFGGVRMAKADEQVWV